MSPRAAAAPAHPMTAHSEGDPDDEAIAPRTVTAISPGTTTRKASPKTRRLMTGRAQGPVSRSSGTPPQCAPEVNGNQRRDNR